METQQATLTTLADLRTFAGYFERLAEHLHPVEDLFSPYYGEFFSQNFPSLRPPCSLHPDAPISSGSEPLSAADRVRAKTLGKYSCTRVACSRRFGHEKDDEAILRLYDAPRYTMEVMLFGKTLAADLPLTYPWAAQGYCSPECFTADQNLDFTSWEMRYTTNGNPKGDPTFCSLRMVNDAMLAVSVDVGASERLSTAWLIVPRVMLQWLHFHRHLFLFPEEVAVRKDDPCVQARTSMDSIDRRWLLNKVANAAVDIYKKFDFLLCEEGAGSFADSLAVMFLRDGLLRGGNAMVFVRNEGADITALDYNMANGTLSADLADFFLPSLNPVPQPLAIGQTDEEAVRVFVNTQDLDEVTIETTTLDRLGSDDRKVAKHFADIRRYKAGPYLVSVVSYPGGSAVVHARKHFRFIDNLDLRDELEDIF